MSETDRDSSFSLQFRTEARRHILTKHIINVSIFVECVTK
jgi:hypothetical protein